MTTIVRSPSDWIIFFGPTSSYALGPIAYGEGTPFKTSCGHYTDHPQLAIGWASREEAEAALAAIGSPSKAKVVQRAAAEARWTRGLGTSMGRVDWGSTAG